MLKLHLQIVNALRRTLVELDAAVGKGAGADPAARPPADDDARGSDRSLRRLVQPDLQTFFLDCYA